VPWVFTPRATTARRVVGVTLSEPQQRYATEQARLAWRERPRRFSLQDFRDINDEPFDAISSIGMSEHVGRKSLPNYTHTIWELLRPGGRFLNHAIGRPVSFDDDPQPSRASELNRQTSDRRRYARTLEER
jgi:cyclopropane fatty-acyl-phospholipid synthase-like methyltransferase